MPSAYAHPDDPARAQQRVLHLHRRLAAGEALSKVALAEDLGVSAKTVQRDLAALRADGAPLAYDAARRGHVYTDPTWQYRPPHLSDDEQVALMVAENALEQYEDTQLHADLAAAIERLGWRLPEAVRARHRLVSDAIHFGGLPPPAIDPAVWDALLMAIQAREVVRIDYAKLGEAPLARRPREPARSTRALRPPTPHARRSTRPIAPPAHYSTRTSDETPRPNTSGVYISSAVAGGSTKSPGVVARAR